MVINLPETELYTGARRIAARLRSAGFPTLIVGGAVRDTLLGKPVKDIDLATAARPEQVRELFAHTVEVGAAFGIIVVIEEGRHYEVATFREEREYADGRHPQRIDYTDSPLLDAARRDFTVNAIFCDPASGEIHDYFDGLGDLRRGVIRTVGDPAVRFREDYLRMLRAVRFAARFGYEIEPTALAAIRAGSSNLMQLSSERVRAELDGMLTGPDPAGAMSLLQEAGMLAVVLPEVAAMVGVEQPAIYHPEGDVWVHTLLMLKHLGWSDSDLAWSVLLHDIGKPATRAIGEDGIAHFYRHEEVGAEMADALLRRLKFPRRNSERIVHAVRHHMRFAHVDKMRRSTWRSLLAEPDFALELELHRIDCSSSHRMLQNYVLLLDRLAEVQTERKLPDPLVHGIDLMAIGIKPGPGMGKLLKLIREKQLDGELHTREEAIALAMKTTVE